MSGYENEVNWLSDRRIAELEHERRVELFDRYIDMVLDQTTTITLEDAIGAYGETLAFEGIPISEQ